MGQGENIKRRYERIKLPYVLKFRCTQAGHETDWDAVNPIDMSETGICFLTMDRFTPGFTMELHITNSILKKECVYDCRVFRSDRPKERPMFFQTVVIIEDMEEGARKAYMEVLKAFHDEAQRLKKGGNF